MVAGGARARVDVSRTVVLDPGATLRGSSDAGLFAALEPPLFLVDGNNLLWRAAHGHPAPFTARDGSDLTPLFRFFSMLRRSVGSWGVFAECIVCFDGPEAWGNRLEIDATYKSNRSYDDKDLSFMRWLPEIHAALESAGVLAIEIADREADDVIATLSARAGERHVRILSTDRDYFQLLGPRVTVANTRTTPALVNEDVLFAAHGVRAGQWCDFRALAGDPSDGIPGVPGVGPKRAASILRDGVSLDDLLETGRLDPDVEAAWEDVSRWRRLIQLDREVATDVRLTGTTSPKLPPPGSVCRELHLI